ncbi:MAG: hypothetical protein ACSHYB_13620 [Roseibacillus sp.]
MKALLPAIFLLVSGMDSWGQVGETRTWTSADGRPLEGKLVELSAEQIVVEKNGRPVKVPVRLLSEEDQKLVTELVAKQEAEKALAEKDEARSGGFEEGPYADAVKGEWVLGDEAKHGMVHQLFIGKEVTRKKAGPVVPLFVNLHGASARADSVEAGKVEIAPQTITKSDWYEDYPCVVLVPTCPPEPMTWTKDVILTKLEALIDDLVNSLPIDRDRIYLCGYSMGGQGIGKLIERRPTLYAGAVFADGGPKDSWVGQTKTPMWSYYSKDRDSSNVENLQGKFQEDGIEFRATILPDADHNGIHWKLAKDPEVWEWLFEQKLP